MLCDWDQSRLDLSCINVTAEIDVYERVLLISADLSCINVTAEIRATYEWIFP